MIKINGKSVSRIPINGKETLRVMKNGEQLWSGTGLPAGYTLLEYIESTGQQYIDTGFKPNQDTRVVMKIIPKDKETGFIYGARTAQKKDSHSLVVYNETLRFDYAAELYPIDISPLQTLFIDIDKNNAKVNNTTVTAVKSSFYTPCSLTLFAMNTNGTIEKLAKAKLYFCQIYDNGTLVRDFVPVKEMISGTYGLYDKVNKQFYGSASSTPFTGA